MAAAESTEQLDMATPGYVTKAPDDIATSTTTIGTESKLEATTESTIELPTATTTAPPAPTTTLTTQIAVTPENSTFEIHFMDVG